ncbi:hypothetical protein VD0002_g8444 [Verticillium dahliae]|uniref:CENP-V/GFA domain-containing protein n=2 Tax=Verticillium dahliae TaxID=27337 RepID=G2WZF7_VERDV|nr:uncharacterized protein VDAG_03399 [Verticillium dahliae VdLs.17]KAF3344650.1 hypothetical protein VdG2_06836 [Verticillium dahliae VDG2]KAF3351912.1 hypothetical protein VdG1_09524 [Verticillium dahliae VDG1]KAH6703799.1 Mss4-like protein [Verticillium dahliae]EGY21959.1 hypothetical protein VDAG_03399 [Verticillium dahliae VdLs.17]PNH26842.1 hypothetical protein BJF96_g9855 [Verticillium dahliae]
MVATDPKTPGPFIPLASLAQDGWSNDDEATATCLCGTVQFAFSTQEKHILNRFVCHCADCRKLSSSMFCSAFSVPEEAVRFLRGKENVKVFQHHQTTASGKAMSNYFCATCGNLMYRTSAMQEGFYIIRLGVVDDFRLAETKLRPNMEVYIGTKVDWVPQLENMAQIGDVMALAKE